MNPYTLLGLATSATGAEVRAAWKAKALELHPDRCKEPNAALRYAEARAAYDLLSDPDERRRYDAAAKKPAQLEALWRRFGEPTERQRVGLKILDFLL